MATACLQLQWYYEVNKTFVRILTLGCVQVVDVFGTLCVAPNSYFLVFLRYVHILTIFGRTKRVRTL